MKQIAILFITITVLSTTSAFASIFDKIKGIGGIVGITAVAFILTGIMAIGGLVTKAKWLSTILIAIGTLISNIGLMLQDGKVDKTELERAKEDIKKIKAVLKTKP